jgi:hypothetical protein
MWSDHGMIRPHAKWRRRGEWVRRRSTKNKATFDHFVRSQAAGDAQDGQSVPQNWIFSVDTLHVVGIANGPEAVWKNKNNVLPCWALTRRVSAHNGQYLTSRLYVSAVTWNVIRA